MPITNITLDVDDATYRKWSVALSALQRPLSIPLRVVMPIPGIPSPPSFIEFSGVELLDMVGRACTRPHIIDDPERLFALLRYATRISSRGTNAQLAREVRTMDSHKKRVLSDEMGSGFSMLICRRLLGTTLFLDLREAIRRRQVRTQAPKSRQPDFIALPGPNNEMVVLEAKGTQSRGYCLRRQIPAGCKQVRGVRISGGTSPIRVVIGVELGNEDTWNSVAFVGDPPEAKDSHEYVFSKFPEMQIAVAHFAKLALFTGDVSLARKLDPEADYGPNERVLLAKRTVMGRDAFGSILAFRSQDSESGIFIGLDSELSSSILEAPAKVLISASQLSNSVATTNRKSHEFSYASGDGLVIDVWLGEGESAQPPLEQEVRL